MENTNRDQDETGADFNEMYSFTLAVFILLCDLIITNPDIVLNNEEGHDAIIKRLALWMP